MFGFRSRPTVEIEVAPKTRVPLTQDERDRIRERDKHTCKYCGVTGPDVKWHIDHLKPVSQGGTNNPGNLVLSCQSCNLRKGGMNPRGITTGQKIRSVKKDRERERGTCEPSPSPKRRWW